jgi:hypothetical protein
MTHDDCVSLLYTYILMLKLFRCIFRGGPSHRGPPQPKFCGGPDRRTPTGSAPMVFDDTIGYLWSRSSWNKKLCITERILAKRRLNQMLKLDCITRSCKVRRDWMCVTRARSRITHICQQTDEAQVQVHFCRRPRGVTSRNEALTTEAQVI